MSSSPAQTGWLPGWRPSPYRDPDDQIGRRWAPTNPPTFLPDLLRAYLDGTEPTLRRWREAEASSPYALGDVDARRRRDLVEWHVAVRVPPTGPEPSEQITLHPDIAFALRLTIDPPRPIPHGDGYDPRQGSTG